MVKMTLCGEGCTPCCDFCIYSIRDIWVDENDWESDQGQEGYCFRIKEK